MSLTPQTILSEPLSLIRGVPGSGKSNLAIDTAIAAYQNQKRVIIVTTSNAQNFDLARRISYRNAMFAYYSYHRSDLEIPSILSSEAKRLQEQVYLPMGHALFWGMLPNGLKQSLPFLPLIS